MKRTLIMLGGLAALAAAYVGNQLWAQGQPAPPAAPATTRVAFINIETVLQNYKKAQVYKQEMDKMIEPFRAKAEKLKKELLAWQTDLNTLNKVAPGDRERYEFYITKNKRDLEDLQREVGKLYAKNSETQIVQIYKEIDEAVKAHALSNGFHAVFCFGTPQQSDPLSLENIVRVIRGMTSTGCVTPIYFAPGLDISAAVTASLNARYATTAASGSGITPTGGTAVPQR